MLAYMLLVPVTFYGVPFHHMLIILEISDEQARIHQNSSHDSSCPINIQKDMLDQSEDGKSNTLRLDQRVITGSKILNCILTTSRVPVAYYRCPKH